MKQHMSEEILALPYECWGWFPGYEGIAQVSTSGQVQTVDRWVTDKNGVKRFLKGRVLKPARDKDGYLRIVLSRDGKQRNFTVHRMVLEVWGDGNPEGKPQINHRDEDKTNNSVENLSYCTAKANIRWGTGIERRAASQSKAVLALDPKTGEVVKEFPSMNEAGRKGFTQGAISACCNGKKLSHRGFVWKYKDDYDQENAWTPVKIGVELKPVQAIDPSTGEVVLEFQSTAEAGRKGFDSGHISKCCLGVKKYKTHHGYKWRYK